MHLIQNDKLLYSAIHIAESRDPVYWKVVARAHSCGWWRHRPDGAETMYSPHNGFYARTG